MKIGFIAGAFDLLHPGHIHLFKQAKRYCDFLIVGLHINPSIERKQKNKPIESVLERRIKIRACKFVDDVVVYETEADLPIILEYFNVGIRFLGSDYQTSPKPITAETVVPIKYINSLSIHTSDIRERIKKA